MAESDSMVVITTKTEQLNLNSRRHSEELSGEGGLESSSSTTNGANLRHKKPTFVSKSKRMNTIRKIEDRSKNPSQFRSYHYHCNLCSSYLKDECSITDHVKSEGHMERLEAYYTNIIINCLPDATNSQLSAMTRLVERLYEDHSAHIQDEIRLGVAEELNKLIKPVIQDAHVELFGSSRMKCALKSSDINLNVNTDGTEISNNEVPEMFLNILQIFKTKGMKLYSEVTRDFYSLVKIPRILFKHSESQLYCELRIGSYAPCQVSALIALYNELDPRVSKLCVAMKYWAKVFGVDSTINGYYPSVIFVVMVLHYLQQTTPPVLPVLHEEVVKSFDNSNSKNDDSGDQEGRSSAVGHEPEYHQLELVAKNWKSSNTSTVGELLNGFFKYYVVDFDHRKYAVSIRSSDPILRSTRDGWGSNRLAVEDPFLIKNNISKATGSDKVYEFLFKCLTTTYFHLLQLKNKLQSFVEGIIMGSIEELPEVDPTEIMEDRGEEEDDLHEDTKKCEEDSKVDDDNKANVINDTSGSRNVTAEVLAEHPSDQVKNSGVDRRAARAKRYRAQVMKALNERIVEEEKQDYTFDTKYFHLLLKDPPVACICCKRARHVAEECPDEVIPRLHVNINFPQVGCIRSLDEAFNKYMNYVSLRPEQEQERERLSRRILSDIHDLYPKASLELFGSSANGFGHCNSDLDLCLIMNEEYQCEKIEIIEILAKHFKTKELYKWVNWIRSARVPIIKLSVSHWKLDCDISMENRLALHNTRMLAMYATIDPRVRVLGYAIKYFAKRCDMCDASSGSISSYAYILMVIHFLQQCKILPVLQKLSLNPRKPLPTEPIVEGWNCYFFDKIHQLHEVWQPADKSKYSGELWLRFLLYYSRDFDWKHGVVTIRQLEPLEKFIKNWASKPMAIEDPFNLDHNLAQAVSAKMRFYIIKRFQKALQYHTKPNFWRSMDEVMDSYVLCENFRPPKFKICDKCNRRGHKAVDCKKENKLDGQNQNPIKTADRGRSGNEEDKVSDKRVPTPEPKHNPDEADKSRLKTNPVHLREVQSDKNGSRSLPQPEDECLDEVDRSSNNSNVKKTRSQLRQELIDQTDNNYDQLKAIHKQLRTVTRSGRSTSYDKRRLHACGDLLKKLQKQFAQDKGPEERQSSTKDGKPYPHSPRSKKQVETDNVVVRVIDRRPTNHRSSDCRSSDHRSSDHRSSDLRPTDHGPTDHGPTDHGPTDHRPTDHRFSDHRSTDHRSTDHTLSDHRSTDHRSTDHTPSDHRSTDHRSTDHRSADHRSTDYRLDEPILITPPVPLLPRPLTFTQRPINVVPHGSFPLGHAPMYTTPTQPNVPHPPQPNLPHPLSHPPLPLPSMPRPIHQQPLLKYPNSLPTPLPPSGGNSLLPTPPTLHPSQQQGYNSQ